MLMRSIISLLISLCSIAAAAQSSYDSYAVKAQRYFGYKEWASAAAIYSILISDRPEVTSNYSHAIVAAGMLGDSIQQMNLTHIALTNQISVDSLFSAIERTSFEVEQTSLYEDYLLLIRADSPWLTRVINGYLLRYYTYRSYGPGIVEYSRMMLEGAPTDERFLMSLAEGQLLCGDTEVAINTYRHIVELNPQCYKALLYLGNYYKDKTDETSRAFARYYLQAACDLRSTPYVEQALKNLQ